MANFSFRIESRAAESVKMTATRQTRTGNFSKPFCQIQNFSKTLTLHFNFCPVYCSGVIVIRPDSRLSGSQPVDSYKTLERGLGLSTERVGSSSAE